MRLTRPLFTLAIGTLVVAFSGDPKIAVGQVPPSFGDWCGLKLAAETQNRHVYGDVNTECGGGCSFGQHTPPFGNWGVNSWFGPLYDGDQYKGWGTSNPYCPNESIDDPEGNSCRDSFPPSLYWYYNYPEENPSSQFSGDVTGLGWVYDWYSTTDEEGCSILDGWQLGGGTVLEIREIDPWSPDDPVTTLKGGGTG